MKFYLVASMVAVAICFSVNAYSGEQKDASAWAGVVNADKERKDAMKDIKEPAREAEKEHHKEIKDFEVEHATDADKGGPN